jgi:hypothetical protein
VLPVVVACAAPDTPRAVATHSAAKSVFFMRSALLSCALEGEEVE